MGIEMVSGESANPTGDLIRRARTHAALTQAGLARRVHTTQSAVSRWERGHDEPRLTTLAAILRACGLRLELRATPDDVDRAQIRQQLAMTPTERLASVTNVSRTLASARRVG
jgi:transcriptional regulator with XRE-family HTH domain